MNPNRNFSIYLTPEMAQERAERLAREETSTTEFEAIQPTKEFPAVKVEIPSTTKPESDDWYPKTNKILYSFFLLIGAFGVFEFIHIFGGGTVNLIVLFFLIPYSTIYLLIGDSLLAGPLTGRAWKRSFNNSANISEMVTRFEAQRPPRHNHYHSHTYDHEADVYHQGRQPWQR